MDIVVEVGDATRTLLCVVKADATRLIFEASGCYLTGALTGYLRQGNNSDGTELEQFQNQDLYTSWVKSSPIFSTRSHKKTSIFAGFFMVVFFVVLYRPKNDLDFTLRISFSSDHSISPVSKSIRRIVIL